MDVATFNLFFALLALVALAGAAAAVFVTVTPAAPLRRLRADLAPAAPALAALVAATCMAGSLYYSEVAHFVPCKLCWYQRIAMYPLAIILTVAAFRRDRAIRPYALILALLGAAISAYHFQLQLFPEQSTFCSAEIPCTVKEVEEFGFLTIPFMAGSGFLAIAALLTVAGFTPNRAEEATHP